MLSIGSMSGGQAGYYLGLAREDYYLQGGEPPGQWHGVGAERLGLSGQVEADHLYNLFDGFSPDGSRPLVQFQNHEGKAGHRPGWDLTFSAPKSVSVLWSQSSPENRQKIQEAHDQAVMAALDYLQESAALTRRGRRGGAMEATGLVVARFEHSTSRALDPQLHTHALVMNVGVRDDGTTGTVSSLSIFQSKMAAGAIYRADFSARLEQEFGIPVERKSSWFEVSGSSDALVKEFSKRREAIEQTLKAKGQASAEASAVAALETRDAKEAASREKLFADWHEVGRNHGWSSSQADRLFGAYAPVRDKSEDLRICAEEAARRLTEGTAHFSERDYVRHFAESAQAMGLYAGEILAAARDHLRQSPDIVRLGTSHGEERYTTTEMLELETRLIGHAEALASDSSHSIDADHAVRGMGRFSSLSEEQSKALWHVTHETGRLAVVSGMAGTGKTRMLESAREMWEEAGFSVYGAALAARAGRELQEGSGIESATIARRLLDIERGKSPLRASSVLVVDEAGMVATPEMERLARHVKEAGAKLVLIGDERQLQPIGPGAPFMELGERFGRSELNEIRRQSEAWARKAVKDFADGNAREALAAFAERGLVNVAETKAEAMEQLVKAWREDPSPAKETLLLAGTRKEVKALNRLAQEAKIEAGELSGPSTVLHGEKLFIGDRVMFTKNRRSLGVDNGSRGTVENISGDGERVGVRLDNGQRVSFEVHRMEDVALGYAATTHKAQGATASRVYVLAGGSMQDREISYVQASRSRAETRFFVTRPEAGDAVAVLAREMERTRQKEMAQTVLRRQAEIERISHRHDRRQ